MRHTVRVGGLAVMVLALLGGAAPTASAATDPDGWVISRASAPARTLVRNGAGDLLAEFTDRASIVVVAGPPRTLTEAGTTATVVTDRWVRVLPAPFAGVVTDETRSWLRRELTDRSPDVLAVAMEYASGGPHDARYMFGADFNDDLGIPWTYGHTVDRPEANELGALDCSGFVRMVFGYRLGIPMTIGPRAGTSLPRKAADQYANGPGVVIGSQTTTTPALDVLRPGDLVFFDASTADGTAIDHVGMYVGRDGSGHYRFVSSRRSADGPTMGDSQGASIIDGSGYWARSLRGIRRI